MSAFKCQRVHFRTASSRCSTPRAKSMDNARSYLFANRIDCSSRSSSMEKDVARAHQIDDVCGTIADLAHTHISLLLQVYRANGAHTSAPYRHAGCGPNTPCRAVIVSLQYSNYAWIDPKINRLQLERSACARLSTCLPEQLPNHIAHILIIRRLYGILYWAAPSRVGHIRQPKGLQRTG